MKFIKGSIFSAFCFLFFNISFAGDQRCALIDKYVSEINGSSRNLRAENFYTDADGYQNHKWKKTSLDTENFKKSLFQLGEYRSTNNALEKVELKLWSQAGEWNDDVIFYFYKNGSVCYVEQKHYVDQGYDLKKDEDLEGSFVVLNKTYFSEKGTKILTQEKASSTKSKKQYPASYFSTPIDVDVPQNSSIFP